MVDLISRWFGYGKSEFELPGASLLPENEEKTQQVLHDDPPAVVRLRGFARKRYPAQGEDVSVKKAIAAAAPDLAYKMIVEEQVKLAEANMDIVNQICTGITKIVKKADERGEKIDMKKVLAKLAGQLGVAEKLIQGYQRQEEEFENPFCKALANACYSAPKMVVAPLLLAKHIKDLYDRKELHGFNAKVLRLMYTVLTRGHPFANSVGMYGLSALIHNSRTGEADIFRVPLLSALNIAGVPVGVVVCGLVRAAYYGVCIADGMLFLTNMFAAIQKKMIIETIIKSAVSETDRIKSGVKSLVDFIMMTIIPSAQSNYAAYHTIQSNETTNFIRLSRALFNTTGNTTSAEALAYEMIQIGYEESQKLLDATVQKMKDVKDYVVERSVTKTMEIGDEYLQAMQTAIDSNPRMVKMINGATVIYRTVQHAGEMLTKVSDATDRLAIIANKPLVHIALNTVFGKEAVDTINAISGELHIPPSERLEYHAEKIDYAQPMGSSLSWTPSNANALAMKPKSKQRSPKRSPKASPKRSPKASPKRK